MKDDACELDRWSCYRCYILLDRDADDFNYIPRIGSQSR
jgi:hypothetical protein